MSESTLGKLLSIIEASDQSLSVSCLARELNIRPERVEGYLDFWVRKGRIKLSTPQGDCGSCPEKGDCPFVFDLTRTYELISVNDLTVNKKGKPS
jgi:hypothetical protein